MCSAPQRQATGSQHRHPAQKVMGARAHHPLHKVMVEARIAGRGPILDDNVGSVPAVNSVCSATELLHLCVVNSRGLSNKFSQANGHVNVT